MAKGKGAAAGKGKTTGKPAKVKLTGHAGPQTTVPTKKPTKGRMSKRGS